MPPEFLSLDEVLAIHRDQIERYGGSHGVRDRNLLDSAVATPAVGFSGRYLHADLFEMAAAYLFHLVQNHPFIDGNKRVGAVAADVFLSLNGLTLTADQQSYYDLVSSAARGQVDKQQIAQFFRDRTQPV